MELAGLVQAPAAPSHEHRAVVVVASVAVKPNDTGLELAYPPSAVPEVMEIVGAEVSMTKVPETSAPRLLYWSVEEAVTV